MFERPGEQLNMMGFSLTPFWSLFLVVWGPGLSVYYKVGGSSVDKTQPHCREYLSGSFLELF